MKPSLAMLIAATLLVSAHGDEPNVPPNPLGQVGVYQSPLSGVGQPAPPAFRMQTHVHPGGAAVRPYRSSLTFKHFSAGSMPVFDGGYGGAYPQFPIYAAPIVTTPYSAEYSHGIRTPKHRSYQDYRRGGNAYGGPWYYPGSTTNTSRRGRL